MTLVYIINITQNCVVTDLLLYVYVGELVHVCRILGLGDPVTSCVANNIREI